jgi:methionyl-tRNA synthetase
MDMISFEDFKKVENADKLLKLQVDFGDFQRQIVSGIAESFTPEELIGKKLPFIVNLEYRKFKGQESQGMLMAIDADDKTILLEPGEAVKEGAEVV